MEKASQSEGILPSVSDERNDEGFEWEMDRENILPTRSGRKVSEMNKVLSCSIRPKPEVIANAKFDEMMVECEDALDPLEICLRFCAWFETQFPIGRQRLFYGLLWKLVKKYALEDRYLNDPRMLKLWTKLADNSLGHGFEIYQHANSIGSLTICAQLYIRWAQDLEMRGDIRGARGIFQRAKRMGASPLENILAEEDELEMREMRRNLQRAEQDDSGDEFSEEEWDENGQRVALTRIAAIDQNTAPIVRLPSIVGERGSSRLNRGSGQKASCSSNGNEFEVFADDESTEEDYLERIYDMHIDNHIERLAFSTENREKLKAVPMKPSSFSEGGNADFVVWCDDQEMQPAAVAVEKKPKLAFMKRFLKELSFEENMVIKWELQNREKNIVKTLDFDD